MTRAISRLTTIILFLSMFAVGSAAAEKFKCAECGMIVDEDSRFSARIVDAKSTLHFCDIGDLLTYLKDKKRPAAGAQVKDYLTGEWLDAAAAFYVHAPKRFTTPMGWSVAAFRDRDKAQSYGSPVDLPGMSAALK